MTKTSNLARCGALALLWALTGCPDSQGICPQGFRPSVERGSCVPIDAGGDPAPAPEVEMADASTDRGVLDATTDTEAPLDATPPTDADLDAGDASEGVDAEAGTSPDGDSGADAEAGTSPVPEGGMPDAGTPDATDGDGEAGIEAPVCSEDDRLAWAAFHTSTSLLPVIDGCASQPGCALGLCPLVECLHDGAGLLDCESCVQDEVRCVFNECFDACRNDSDNATCLACACEAGCITLFEQCTGEPLDACNACEPAIAYCRGMHPWPALFVPIMM